jgi:hypothetical protein
MEKLSESRTQECADRAALGGKVARRSLLRAGLAVGPVMLATSGRSALAQSVCGSGQPAGLSAMTWLSVCPNGNGVPPVVNSHTVKHFALGSSPGYWKPNPNGQTFQGPWPHNVSPFVTLNNTQGTSKQLSVTESNSPITWNNSDWSRYRDLSWADPGWKTGTKLGWLSGDSLTYILIHQNGSLMWHIAAAYLNALMSEQSGGTSYALTSAEVESIWVTKTLVAGGTFYSDSVLNAFLEQTWA